jgi:hypothetical protein
VVRRADNAEWETKAVAVPALVPSRMVNEESSMKKDNIEVDKEGNNVYLSKVAYLPSPWCAWSLHARS